MRTILTFLILLTAIWSVNAKSLRIFKAETPPTIDGNITAEDNWSDTWQTLDQNAVFNSTNSMSANFQMKYDEFNLYVLIKVNDAYKDTSFSMNWWEKDDVQVYVAMDTNSYSNFGLYTFGDFQFAKIWANNNLIGNIGGNQTTMSDLLLQYPNFIVGETSDDLSYMQEWQIPWAALIREMPNGWDGSNFKFDIAATDITPTGRTQLTFWNSGADQQWNNTRYFGNVTLDSAINPPATCWANFSYYKDADVIDSIIGPGDSITLSKKVTVHFINQSSESVSSVLWSFGDGTQSTELNPSHTYDIYPWSTTVTACMKAYTSDGAVCQKCQNIVLYQPPFCSASFWYYQPWNGNGYYFYDMSQGNVISWEWDFGDGTTSTEEYPYHIFENVFGNVYVTLKITTSDGCQSYASNWIYIPMPPADQICQVTVDKKTGKNLIKWSPTSGNNIKEYNIQKETSVRDVFTTIATVKFDKAGSYIDKSSNPEKHADRYRLETINENGYSYGFSDVHQTLHLAVSQGNPLYYNLTWTPYLGFYFGTYYIYRGKSEDRLVLIDSISANQTQYTDNYSGKAYYRVGVRSNYPCRAFRDSIIYLKSMVLGAELQEDDDITLSNIESLNATGISDETSLTFNASPNPFDNQIILTSEINNSKVSIEVYNTLGEKIYSYNTTEVVNGHFEHIINAADLEGATRVCIIKFTAGNQTGISKLIKR